MPDTLGPVWPAPLAGTRRTGPDGSGLSRDAALFEVTMRHAAAAFPDENGVPVEPFAAPGAAPGTAPGTAPGAAPAEAPARVPRVADD